MDRVNEVKQQIEAAVKEALPHLNNPSKTAEYKQWINIFASIQANAEAIIEQDKCEIAAIVENNRIGTAAWYIEQAKLFQWADQGSSKNPYHLVVEPSTGIIKYNILNPEARIITQAACVVADNAIKVKVATGQPGNLHPITNQQELDLKNYLSSVKIAGVNLEVVNKPADILEVRADVYYNPAYNINQLKEQIIEALDRYSLTLPYDGAVYRSSVIDAIQSVAGVIDVELSGSGSLVAIKNGVREEVGRHYITDSGYFNFKKDDGFPTINFYKNND